MKKDVFDGCGCCEDSKNGDGQIKGKEKILKLLTARRKVQELEFLDEIEWINSLERSYV